MASYKLTLIPGVVQQIEDDGTVRWAPATDPAYLAWLAAGNTATPADPPPLKYDDATPIPSRRVRTTNATVTEIARFTVPPNTKYTARMTVTGVTDTLNAIKEVGMVATAARAGGGAVVIPAPVGNQTYLYDHKTANAQTWGNPTLTVSGNEAIISVQGAAATGINWLLVGTFETFIPGGA